MANYKEPHFPNKEVANAFANAWGATNSGMVKKKPTAKKTVAKKPSTKGKK